MIPRGLKRRLDSEQYNLKPCPFCGEEKELWCTFNLVPEQWCPDIGDYEYFSNVRCFKCGAFGSNSTDKQQAIVNWNRRKEE